MSDRNQRAVEALRHLAQKIEDGEAIVVALVDSAIGASDKNGTVYWTGIHGLTVEITTNPRDLKK